MRPCRINLLVAGQCQVVPPPAAFFNPAAETPGPLDLFADFSGPPFQVCPLDRSDARTDPNPFADPEEITVITGRKDRIIGLREEVIIQDEAMAGMLQLQGMNSGNIRTNTKNIRALKAD